MQNKVTVRQIQLEGNAVFRYWALKDVGCYFMIHLPQERKKNLFTTLKLELSLSLQF